MGFTLLDHSAALTGTSGTRISATRRWTWRGLRLFCVLSCHAVGVGAIATFGLKGSKDANLPITKGPQTTGENGKGGSVRSRL